MRRFKAKKDSPKQRKTLDSYVFSGVVRHSSPSDLVCDCLRDKEHRGTRCWIGPQIKDYGATGWLLNSVLM